MFKRISLQYRVGFDWSLFITAQDGFCSIIYNKQFNNIFSAYNVTYYIN